MQLKALVGSGDKIGLFTLPFAIVGLILNLVFPSTFSVGGPPVALAAISACIASAGVVVWIWAIVLILKSVPRGELIARGPYAWVKHPLYTGVSLLVLPFGGFLLDSWLGVPLGVVMYIASRLFSPAEEADLERTFGAEFRKYRDEVKLPWL